MHRWVASSTTATPSGFTFSRMVSAIWLVSRSWICSRRENVSTSRGILLKPMHPPLRNVGDVAAAEERQQMMLAQAVEVDVLDDHHLVIIDGEQGVVEDRIDVRRIPAREEPQRFLDALGRVEQPLARRVFAKLREELPDDVPHLRYCTSRSSAAPAPFAQAQPLARPPARPAADPDALYAQRDELASARRAETIWAERLQRDPRDFASAWKLARVRYWLGGHAPEAERKSAPRIGHRRRTHRRSRSRRTNPKATSGSPPTWARWPSRSACARA